MSDRYPFLTNYLTQAVTASDRPLPQSIIFYGNDLDAQYTLAQEFARILNCKESKSDDCTCINCKWIKENTHPAVKTISRIDNKPEDDDAKTVISIKQSRMIQESLINSSEFYRVFIFCDRDNEGNISGLNQINFQEPTANSLLKIIEEPQPGVVFIFLARYINDIISTIISRSQCFFVPALPQKTNEDYGIIENILKGYWNFSRNDIFDISQKLIDLTKDYPPEKILDSFQYYILAILKSNTKQTELIKHIELIENAKKQAKCGIKPANIFDDLLLKIIT